jgi:hypothetical protein
MAIWQFWVLIAVLVAILLAIIKVNDTIGVNGVRLESLHRAIKGGDLDGSLHDAIKMVYNILDEISEKTSAVESVAAAIRSNTSK